MTPDERQLITGLFERIRTAASAPRDREAETLIADAVRELPYAPYLLVQTVLIQEEALKTASGHIEELEAKLKAAEAEKAQPTSFLGGLLGGKTPSGVPSFGTAPQPASSQPQPTAGVWNTAPRPNAPQPQAQPWGQAQQPQPQPWGQAAQQGYAQPQQGGFGSGMGGSFLGSALATAAGVAGGALLFQGLQSAFNSHHSTALLDQAAPAGGFTGSDPTAGLSGFGDAPTQYTQLPPERPTDDAGFFGSSSADNIQDASYDDMDDGGGDSDNDWA